MKGQNLNHLLLAPQRPRFLMSKIVPKDTNEGERAVVGGGSRIPNSGEGGSNHRVYCLSDFFDLNIINCSRCMKKRYICKRREDWNSLLILKIILTRMLISIVLHKMISGLFEEKVFKESLQLKTVFYNKYTIP